MNNSSSFEIVEITQAELDEVSVSGGKINWALVAWGGGGGLVGLGIYGLYRMGYDSARR